MPRIAACIEYCGKNYHGWQRQNHALSVQETVESAISKVANEKIIVVSSGRTDTGVHGIGQIVHFDTTSVRTEFEWTRGVNTFLPGDVSMIWVCPVIDEFHARFKARQRTYRYILLNRETSPSYLDGLVTWHRMPLEIQKMQQAAKLFLGVHDFSAFRSAGCQNKNPVKNVQSVSLERKGDWIWLDITSDGFLHHMVRNIVGVLTRIGEGLENPEWAVGVLKSKDRKCGGMTAPPDGYILYQFYTMKCSICLIRQKYVDFGKISIRGTIITMATKIKICGVKSPEIAAQAIFSGADALGLMLYEGSKRFISIEQAVEIEKAVTPFVSTVGVFANPEVEYIKSALESLSLDFLQFHGDESGEFCRSFELPYIKVVRVHSETNLEEVETKYSDAAALLLDTYDKNALGGTGDTFDWNLAIYKNKLPLILAGGLNSKNVCEAIKTVSPYGIDVSSGVENNGTKDPEKIAEFCNNVHNCR